MRIAFVLVALVLAATVPTVSFAELPQADAHRDSPIPQLIEVGSRGFYALQGPFAEFDPSHPSVEIWAPPGDASAPVVVYAHGGAGYREDDRARVAMFRRHGFATIAFDAYEMNGMTDWRFVSRKVNNLGKQKMIWGVFRGAVAHAANGTRWDSKNIVLYGGSNGGRVVLHAGAELESMPIRAIVAEAPAASGYQLADVEIPTLIPFGRLDNWAGKSQSDYVWTRTYPNSPVSIQDWVESSRDAGRPIRMIFYANAGHLLFDGPLQAVRMRRGESIVFDAYKGAAEGVLAKYERDVMSFVNGSLDQRAVGIR